MSHPIPSHDYSEQSRGESAKEYNIRGHEARKKVAKKMMSTPYQNYKHTASKIKNKTVDFKDQTSRTLRKFRRGKLE
jgi:hypothetical protein